jgi:hypothetical protein
MLKIVSVFCLVNLAWGMTMNQLMAQNQVANTEKIKEHVYYLTSDSLKGRETGTRGGQLAAEYIANQFGNFGLVPLAADNYYHEFELVTLQIIIKPIQWQPNLYLPDLEPQRSSKNYP